MTLVERLNSEDRKMEITSFVSNYCALISRLSAAALLVGVAIGVAGCVIEPAPPEGAYGGACCYAYYDYPVFAPVYYGYGPGGYWGNRRWR